MNMRKIGYAAVAAMTLAAMVVVSSSPAAAWCRWGRCGGGWGWRGPVAAGIVAGAVVGAAAVAVARPRAYYAEACPPGYRLGRAGRACVAY